MPPGGPDTGTVWALFWLRITFFNSPSVQRQACWELWGPAARLRADCHANWGKQRRQWLVKHRVPGGLCLRFVRLILSLGRSRLRSWKDNPCCEKLLNAWCDDITSWVTWSGWRTAATPEETVSFFSRAGNKPCMSSQEITSDFIHLPKQCGLIKSNSILMSLYKEVNMGHFTPLHAFNSCLYWT